MEAAAKQAKDQAELNEVLIWAAARGLIADAEELISRGAEPVTKDKQGNCAVHYAAAHGHTAILQYLAAKGADLEAEDAQARLPLHHAAANEASIEALRYLVKHSTWLDAPDASDNTPLHLAARRGWVPGIKLLVGSGAELDGPNKRSLTALGEATAAGHVEAVRVLLEAGADPCWRAGGYTLLHVAAGLRRTDVLRLLLDQPGCRSPAFVNDSSNSDSATALHAAAMAGSLEAAELLLANGADARLAGSGGALPWQLVPEAGASQEGGRQAGSKKPLFQQQQHAQLVQLLQPAAGIKDPSKVQHSTGSRSSTSTPATSSSTPSQAAAGAAAGAGSQEGRDGAAAGPRDPVEVYSQRFEALDAAERSRRVERLAQLPMPELTRLDYLSPAAKAALGQVHRANQLLGVYRAVAALRADESFQEDAADPQVQAALTDMGRNNNMNKYADQRAVVSVATKLKRFHTVMQECGGVRLGLQDLLIPPGQSLQELTNKDAGQIQQLTKAAAEARAAAVTAIIAGSHQQPFPATAGSGSSGRTTGAAAAVALAGGCEIEPAEGDRGDGGSIEAAGVDTDLDRELLQHKRATAAGGAGGKKAVDPDSMTIGRRMVYELVESFKRAVRLMAIMGLLWGLMWWLGMLPHQQDPQLLEAHMQQAMAARQQQQQQQAAVQAQNLEL